MGPRKPLGVHVPEGGLVARGRQVLAEEPLELRVALPEAEGAAKGPGNQQVALDVAPAPGEELEAALAVARRLGGGAVVAVEDAEGPEPRSGAAPAAKVLERALGLTPPEDHRRADDPAGQRGQQAVGPGSQDLPIPGPLDVEDDIPRSRGVSL